jgi:hypothetical protein
VTHGALCSITEEPLKYLHLGRVTRPTERASLSAMQEFASVSASSIDPAALATTLTAKSAEGWTVVSIVSAGGDITAFLSRATGAEPAVTPVVSSGVSSGVSSVEPAPVAAAAAEPAGWGTAPDSAVNTGSVATTAAAASIYQPQPEPASVYQPQAQPAAYQPAPVAQPAAAASPSVPAGWYADPAGRFELRYWDGGTWTEHVSRAGQQFTDPPVA